MIKEIGSNFWLSPDEIKSRGELYSPAVFGIDGLDYVWLSSGRSSISMAIDNIMADNPDLPRIACVPEFTCHSVYEPFLNKGFEVKTYSINKNLKTTPKEFTEDVKESKAKIVLIHRYFGFDTMPGLDRALALLQSEGVIVIEDVTQCIYSDINHTKADYCAGSIRKWCGVPDGGFIVNKYGKIRYRPTEYNQQCEKLKIEASLKKYRYIFDGEGDKSEFLSLFSNAEKAVDDTSRYYVISPLSAAVQANLDIEEMKEKRRNNYLALISGLEGCVDVRPLFQSLPDGVVPLYMPVWCDDRSGIQSALRDADIYAPIVWPKQKNCPPVGSVADELYKHLLCLPIDQRYDPEDMARMAKVIRSNCLQLSWLSSQEIKPFINQLIDWEKEVTVKYHYPDKNIPRSFFAGKVEQLQNHLDAGNTFFLGVLDKSHLVGYYWAYYADFLFERTWYERSSFLKDIYRGKGIGMYTKKLAETKAKENGCVAMQSMYAAGNTIQRNIFEKLGYYVSRIEVTKKI